MLKELRDGINLMFKEFFNKETNKKQRANMWTFSRMILAFIIPIMVLIGNLVSNPLFYILAAGFTTFGTITDFLDGKSARKYNSVSDFGIKLDIFTDKVFAFMLGISLSLINPLFLLNVLGEAFISCTNIHYHKQNKQLLPKSSYIGKIKQWPLSLAFVSGYLSIFLPQLSLTTNIFVLISFVMELAVSKNYINSYNYQKKDIAMENNIRKDDFNNEHKDETKSLKEEYLNLRNVLWEIKQIKEMGEEKEKIKVRKKQS